MLEGILFSKRVAKRAGKNDDEDDELEDAPSERPERPEVQRVDSPETRLWDAASEGSLHKVHPQIVHPQNPVWPGWLSLGVPHGTH